MTIKLDLRRGKPTARVIAKSINEYGDVVTTFFVKGHRFILPEQNTHRKDSRSVLSSRGVPVITLSTDILNDIAYPVYYGAHQKGMIAGDEIDALVMHPITGEMLCPDEAWAAAAQSGVNWAKAFADAGYHKQLANRHQEAYGYFRATITATSRDNYYGLRRHGDAQPEIHALADAMWDAEVAHGEVTVLSAGEWHTPWIEAEDREEALKTAQALGDESYAQDILCLVSAARCARSSYRTFDGIRSSLQADMRLCLDLIASDPIHSSPFEHVCTPDKKLEGALILTTGEVRPWTGWEHPEDHRNFDGFRQLRAFLERGELRDSLTKFAQYASQ